MTTTPAEVAYATPADAIAREREECAKIAETFDWQQSPAARIRARTASQQNTAGS